MVNILDLLKGQLGSAAVGQIAELIGENNSNTSSAINSILPALIGGLAQKGASSEGATGILDLLNNDNHDGSMFDNISGLLEGGNKTSALMNIGSIALPFILGGKKAGFMNLLSKATGFGGTSTTSLTNLLLPMVLGMVGKQVKSGGLNASGLIDMLSGQKDLIADQLPDGMGDLLGFPKPTKMTSKTEKSSGGLMKWLVPLAIILGAGWFLTKGWGSDAPSKVDEPVETIIEQPSEVTEEVVKDLNDATKYSVDAAGNLIDEAGNIVKKAADLVQDSKDKIGSATKTVTGIKYTIDASGNLVNSTGEILYKAGEFKQIDGAFIDDKGNKLQ